MLYGNPSLLYRFKGISIAFVHSGVKFRLNGMHVMHRGKGGSEAKSSEKG
jgi:hypothetical protein